MAYGVIEYSKLNRYISLFCNWDNSCSKIDISEQQIYFDM